MVMKINKVYREGGTISEMIPPKLNVKRWGVLDGKTFLLEVARDMDYVDFEFEIERHKQYMDNKLFLDIFIYTVRNGELSDLVYSETDLTYESTGLNVFRTINNLHPDMELLFKYFFRFKASDEAIYYKESQKIPISEHTPYSDDQHLYVYKTCLVPELIIGVENSVDFEGFKTDSFITDRTINSYLLTHKHKKTSVPIVNVGGLTLSEGYDYEITEDSVIMFKGSIPPNTVVNVIYTNTNESTGMSTFNLNIQKNISKPKNTISKSGLYKDGEKYGVFLERYISKGFTPIVIYNGLVLSDGLDYDVLEDRRYIEFKGELSDSKLITIYYMAEYSTLTLNSNTVNGLIKLPQQLFYENGDLEVEFSTDISFNEVIYTHKIPYVDAKFMFDFSVKLPESNTYYIRVNNKKKVVTKNGVRFINKIGNGLKIIIK